MDIMLPAGEMVLQLKLFGGVAACLESGERLILPSGKVAALLARLALARDHAQPRNALATLFWEDSAEEQARGSLRYALTILRQALGEAHGSILCSDRHRVWLSGDRLSVDALRFERLITAGTPRDLEDALALYRGELLLGLAIRSDLFEEWVRSERRRFSEMAESALTQLVGHYASIGDVDRAIQTALRLLGLDSLREDIHRSLISLYLHHGRRADALRQFGHCCELLRRELGAEPEDATRRLVEPYLAAIVPTATAAVVQPPSAIVPGTGMPTIAVRPFRLVRPTDRARLAAIIIREGLEFSLSRFSEIRVLHSDPRRSAVAPPPCADFTVEGRLLHDEQRINVEVRLVDSASGSTLWRKELAGKPHGHCGLPEGTIRGIVASICAALENSQLDRLRTVAASQWGSFPLALLARAELSRLTLPSLDAALRLARQAQRLDPHNALAFGMLALARVFQVRMGWADNRSEALSEAHDAASEALVLDYGDAVAHGVLGLVHLWSGAHDLALQSIGRGLELNPHRTELLHWKGLAHDFSGEHEEAIACHKAALRLARHHCAAFATANAMTGAYFQLEKYEEAAAWARKSISMQPDYRRSHAGLAACLAHLGDEHGSAVALAKALALDKDLSLKKQLSGLVYRDTSSIIAWERGFRQAGLH